ncbi:MAG TPA: tetratricopeptide repeat protein [Rhizomicrobium sp.]|nr:tetratricopeptide repeat protein [Rhizomicrobium sp.]
MDAKALNEQVMSALQADELARAEALIKQLGAARPGHPEVALLTGMLRSRQGRYREAAGLLESVLRLSPRSTTILLHLGNALQGQGRFEEAVTRYDAALAIKPGRADVLTCRGNALMELKRFDEALASHNAALALQTQQASLWYNRGTLLLKINHAQEALADFEKALTLSPNFAEALDGKGNALSLLHQPALALSCFEQALVLKPGNTTFLMNHAVALMHLDRFSDALVDYDRILAIDPNYPNLQGQIALAALYGCDWKRMAVVAENLPARIGSAVRGFGPWSLMGYGADGPLLLACARNTLREILPPPSPPLWTGQTHAHDRIRLAYLSPDFRDHPVGVQLAEVLTHHDRARFEVIAISSGNDDGSAIRRRLRLGFDQFHDVQDKGDDDVARLMRTLEVDVAVDLSGHTLGHRFGALAQRPAPVQVTWLGYPGTTGGDFIDYILGDPVVTPPEHQSFYSEKIHALPDCFFPLDTGKFMAAPPTRAEAGLPETGFVFCCFNRNWKITPAVFDIWLRLLQQIPGSVLWLRSYTESSDAALRKRAEEHGLDNTRLIFAGRTARDIHLARHALADLFLDTLPYGAHATAADALTAGLPVLTQLGEMYPGRVGASMLTAAGLPELITRSAEDYEANALALARDPMRLKTIRDKLAANRATAPLFDMARFTRNLEAAYERMLAEKT